MELLPVSFCFLWLAVMGQRKLRCFHPLDRESSRRQRPGRKIVSGIGTGCPGKTALSQGLPLASTAGVRADLSFQDCEQRGASRAHASPGGWFRRARRGKVYGNPHLGGGYRRAHSPASDMSLGKSSQRSPGKHPMLRRILKQKLHSLMGMGSWSGGAPAPVDIKPRDPERDPRLNMGWTCELEAARGNWPATEPPVFGSSRSRSEG